MLFEFILGLCVVVLPIAIGVATMAIFDELDRSD